MRWAARRALLRSVVAPWIAVIAAGAGVAGAGVAPAPAAAQVQRPQAESARETSLRRAAAARVELVAAADAGAGQRALTRFLADYPDSPEADGLAAAVASALIRAGRDADAAEVLVEPRGPRSTLVGAALRLAAGDLPGARGAYLEAASGLTGAAATLALSRVALLDRITAAAGRVVGRSLLLQERDGKAAVEHSLAGLEIVDASDRAPLLAFAASTADSAGLEQEARGIRRRLVEEHSLAQEAPAALLALARGLMGAESGLDEARQALERLIIEYPRSALVPEARRALATVRSRGAG